MKILIVDDSPEQIILLSHALKLEGYEVVTACNGEEAVTAYRAEQPNLVIMDVVMPVMDGYAATAAIRLIDAARPGQWVPIIFLSGQTDVAERARGLEVGGDDYLDKPVNLAMLAQKINALRRIADMQDKITRYANELQAHAEQTQAEQQLAHHLLSNIIKREKTESEHIKMMVVPAAAHFSGDVVLAARAPSNELNILLADATGHGLAAAIGVLPVIESFYSMTNKGYSGESIAREMNRKVKCLLPIERFIAIALISIDYINCTVRVWNGGLPEVYFVTDSGIVKRIWKSAYPALGILSDADFDSNPQVYQWNEPGEIVLCSDGLTEAENEQGEAFGTQQLLPILAFPSSSGRFQIIANAVRAHIGAAPQFDDISLVTIRCQQEKLTPARLAVDPPVPWAASANASRWCVELCLSAVEIRHLDALPLMMSCLDQLKIDAAHRGKAFLVLGELYNNALDHGLLHLDSKLKQAPDGFEQFITLRETRLAALSDAYIKISLARYVSEAGDFLRFHIKDSGDGFDYAAMMQRLATDDQLSGRGIGLARQLCTSFQYEGSGNEVIAIYRLDT